MMILRTLRILNVGLRWRGKLSTEETVALLDLRSDKRKASLTGARELAHDSLIEKRLMNKWGHNLHHSPEGQDLAEWLGYILKPLNGRKG